MTPVVGVNRRVVGYRFTKRLRFLGGIVGRGERGGRFAKGFGPTASVPSNMVVLVRDR